MDQFGATMPDLEASTALPEVLVTPEQQRPAEGALSIDTAPVDQAQPLSIDTGFSAPFNPSDELAASRSLKAYKGTGPQTGMEYEDIYRMIKTGKEQEYRTAAASAFQAAFEQAKLARIRSLGALTGGVTPEQIDWAMANSLPVDPDTVLEQAYANKMTDAMDIASTYLPGSLREAKQEIPEQYEQTKQEVSTFLTKRLFAETLLENVQEELKNQSTGGYIADQLKSIVPGYNEIKLRGLAPTTGSMEGVFLGNNLYKQTREILNLPMDQYKIRLGNIVENLKRDNPSMAAMYLNAVIGQSSSEQITNNIFTGFDAATVAGLGGPLLKKALLWNDVRATAKSIVKGASENGTTEAASLESAGAVNEAAVKRAAVYITSGDEMQRDLETLVSGLRTDYVNIAQNQGSLSREQWSRLLNDYDAAISGLQELIKNTSRVQRIPLQQASEQILKSLQEHVKTLYPGLNNAITDVTETKFFYNPIKNLWSYDIRINGYDGRLFSKLDYAKNFALENGLLDAKIERKGDGFQVIINKPLNENDNILRDLTAQIAGQESPNSWVNALAGRLRTPEDTMSHVENVMRKVATYSSSNFQKYVESQMKYISDIAKGIVRYDPVTGEHIPWYINRPKAYLRTMTNGKMYEEFKRTLAYASEAQHPITKEPGYYFQTPNELYDFYDRNFHRQPTFAETQAYFANSRVYEADRMFRSLLLIRNKGRLGAEQHRIVTLDGEGNKVYSPFFEGIVQKNFPGAGDGDKMVIMGNRPGKEKIIKLNDPKAIKAFNEYRAMADKGEKIVIRIYDPETFPLAGHGNIGNEYVRYVLADKVESKALSLADQLPRKSGGHFEYEFSHAVKMPIMITEKAGKGVEHRYLGEKTVMLAKTKGEAEGLAAKFQAVKQLMKEKKMAEAEALYRKHFAEEWDTFQSWFKTKRGADGKMERPHLSLDHDFYAVAKNESIGFKRLEEKYIKNDITKQNSLIDGTKSGSDARQFQVRYTQARDAEFVKLGENVGTKDNPLYRFRKPDMVDPMITMNRSLNRIINSMFMEDYKFYAVERWLRDAEEWLDADISQVRAAPFYHFNKELPKFVPQIDKFKKEQLIGNWYKIRQFTGIPSKFDTFVNTAAQKLVDAAYEKYGPEGQRTATQKALSIVPIYLLGKVKDPIVFVRSLAYNFKLGLFAVPQMIVQAQTFVTIAALSPGHVLQGSFGALLHQWSRFSRNPKIIEALDSYAAKMGFKPGQWKEAMQELDKTGFGHVAGEYAGLDTALQNKFIRNNFNDFLDLGQVFFKEGERNVRYGAWYTAYHEWRKANPLGRISEADRAEILQRADLLYTNMSRASSSMLHSGVLSLTTQFLSYQIRLAELFLSKRLGETAFDRSLARMRLIGFYSAMYGVPSALGLTGLPAGDLIKKIEIEKYGYNVGQNFWSSLFNEGIPAWTMAMVTGRGDFQKGNWYNVGDRYGAQGFSQIREALRSDKTWWEVIGGAGISTLTGTIAGMDGITRVMSNFLTGNYNNYPLKVDDFVDMFKEVSSVNQAWKVYTAINTGKWMSKSEGYIGDTSKLNAIFMGVTGLQPQEVDNLYTMKWSKETEEEAMKWGAKRFIQEFRRGIQASNDGNDSQANDHFRRAFTIAEGVGYPMERRSNLISLAGKGYESQIDQVRRDFGMRNVPEPLKGTRMQSYTDYLKLKEKREEK